MNWRHRRFGGATRLMSEDGRYLLIRMDRGFSLVELVPFGPEGKGRKMVGVSDQLFGSADEATTFLESRVSA